MTQQEEIIQCLHQLAVLHEKIMATQASTINSLKSIIRAQDHIIENFQTLYLVGRN